MLKNELKKIVYNKILWIITGLSVIVLFVLSFFFMKHVVPVGNAVSHLISKYTSLTDIENNIISLNEAMESLDKNASSYHSELNSYCESLRILEFLKVKGYSYSSLIQTSQLGLLNDNPISFINFINIYTFIAIIIFDLIISAIIFNNDFQNGTYIFIYGSVNPRKKIIISKAAAYLIITSAFALFIFFIQYILSLAYSLDETNIIIVLKERIISLSRGQYFLIVFLSYSASILFYQLLFITVSLFFKNTYTVLGVDILLFIILQIGFTYSSSLLLECFSQPFSGLEELDCSISLFIAVKIFKALLVISLIFLSFFRFEKKNLA